MNESTHKRMGEIENDDDIFTFELNDDANASASNDDATANAAEPRNDVALPNANANAVEPRGDAAPQNTTKTQQGATLKQHEISAGLYDEILVERNEEVAFLNPAYRATERRNRVTKD